VNPKIKKLMIAAILLIVIGGIGCLFTFSQLKSSAVTKKKVITENFSNVEIDSDNSHINILPAEGKEAMVELTGQPEKGGDYTFKTEVIGSTLSVKLREDHFEFPIFYHITHDTALKVYLPEKEYNKMVIKNKNGKIKLEGTNTDHLDITAHNGMIEAKNIRSMDVLAETNNGKIMLEDVSGKITGETHNGEIMLITNTLERSLDLSSFNGRIIVKTKKYPENVRFSTHVDNGDINILNQFDDDPIFGDGDHLIKLYTHNGRIKVEKIK